MKKIEFSVNYRKFSQLNESLFCKYIESTSKMDFFKNHSGNFRTWGLKRRSFKTKNKQKTPSREKNKPYFKAQKTLMDLSTAPLKARTQQSSVFYTQTGSQG